MAYVDRLAFAVTATVSGGAAQTWITPGLMNGYVQAIRYVGGATAPSTAGRFVITAQQSGLEIVNATATGNVTWYPRGAAVNTSNVRLGEGAGASAPLAVYLPLSNEALQIVGTSMGTVSGNGGRQATFHIYVEGRVK